MLPVRAAIAHGLIALVLVTASLMMATQWTAAMLGYHPALGPAWCELLGLKLYAPWKLFVWWLAFDSQAPDVFARAGAVAAFGGIAGGAVAVGGAARRASRKNLITTYGSARWADGADVQSAGLLGDKGLILGLWNGQYLRHDGPEHVIAVAPTRSGKGVGLVVPTLLTWGHSAVIHDIKGENWTLTAGWRSRFSHCLLFDPTNPLSARFNPLLEVRKGEMEVRDVQNIADILVDPDGAREQRDHWEKTAHALLVGTILHVLYAEKEKTLARVATFLADPARSISRTLGIMLTTNHQGTDTTPVVHPVVASVARELLTATFSRYIDSGFGLLAGDVAFLTSILVAIDITLAGLFWALMGEDNVVAQLIRKVLYVGFFALLLSNFQSLADIIFQSFAGLGLRATGTSLTSADLMRPGFVASTGFTASKPLLEKAGELIGITTFFSNFVTIAVLMLAWVIVLLAFFVLSVQLFITIIEFKLTVLAGFVLVPFALFGQTAFLAERVLGNVIASGIKLMVLAIVVGIGSSIFGTVMRPTGEVTLTQAASCILGAISVFGLAIFVPGIAAGLITGAPQLGAGAAVATTAALGGTAVAGGVATAGAARMAGRTTGGAIKSAASLAGRVGAAYEAGGMGGVARATVSGPASRMAATSAAPVRTAYRHGTAQGYRDAAPSGEGDGKGSDADLSGGSTSSSGPPPWAQSLARRQRMTQAGLMAAHALRDGDRAGSSSGPDLKNKT